MVKKILAGSAVFGLAAFSLATTAFADEGWFGGDTTTKVKVENSNNAYIKTDVDTTAKTGYNDANATSNSGSGSSRAKGGNIVTGAATATTDVAIAANTNDTEINLGCGCVGRDGDVYTRIKVDNYNRATVKTYVDTKADTGHNDANADSNSGSGSSRAKGGHIATGAADAWSTVGVVVNTNWTLINHP